MLRLRILIAAARLYRPASSPVPSSAFWSIATARTRATYASHCLSVHAKQFAQAWTVPPVDVHATGVTRCEPVLSLATESASNFTLGLHTIQGAWMVCVANVNREQHELGCKVYRDVEEECELSV